MEVRLTAVIEVFRVLLVGQQISPHITQIFHVAYSRLSPAQYLEINFPETRAYNSGERLLTEKQDNRLMLYIKRCHPHGIYALLMIHNMDTVSYSESSTS